MREYELVYVIQPDAAPEREKEIESRITEIISQGNGTLLLWDDWGKRKLAYEIKKFQKGHYVIANFLGDGKFVTEIERVLRIDQDILRFLTIKIDEKVADIDARIAKAKEEEVERTRKREERERLEAERAEREAARVAALRPPAAAGGGDAGDNGDAGAAAPADSGNEDK